MRVIVDPYQGGVPVTPSDTDLIAPTKGLWVGGAGNLTVDFADGTTDVLLTAPIVGEIYPLSVIRVKAATTATAIVAMY